MAEIKSTFGSRGSFARACAAACLAAALSLPPRSLASGSQEVSQSAKAEEAFLRACGIETDERNLRAILEKIATNDAELARVDRFTRQLADSSFAVRETANRKLLALGPAALPALRRALDQPDLEWSLRVRKCIRAIEDKYNWVQQRAVVRVLLRHPPNADTLSSLVRFLPYTCDETAQDDIWFGAYDWAKRKPILLQCLVPFLRDPLPGRRQLASFVLARLGDKSQRDAAQELLHDSTALVRLRCAQGFLGARNPMCVPTLIELVNEPDVEISWSAEELLFWLALHTGPRATVGGASPEFRAASRAAWRAWWRDRGAQINWNQLSDRRHSPRLLIICDQGIAPRDLGPYPMDFQRVWLCGSDGRPRWSMSNLRISDAQFLPNNRILLAHRIDDESSIVAEHALDGLRKSSKDVGSAGWITRLPNGDTAFGALARFNSDGDWVKTLSNEAPDVVYYRAREHEYRRTFRGGNQLRAFNWDREVDEAGFTWYRLKSPQSIVEVQPNGTAVWKASKQGVADARICFSLVSLGFDR